MLALAALVLTSGLVLDADTAQAAKKKGKGALFVAGTTNKQYSCEGELTVHLALTRNGRTQAFTTPLLRKGGWTYQVSSLKSGRYTLNATVLGHETQAGPTWPEQSVKIKKNKLRRLTLPQIWLDRCDP
jgi:hypothetical protein